MASSALFLNFYTTTLSASLSSTATTMSVSSTTGLPSSLASGQFIPMILTSAAAPGTVYEIVYVTGISGSSLTITRGQEGTSALNWNASDIVYSNNTADTTGAQEGGTFSNPTITGGTISGATIPSGQTLTNDGTISGGNIEGFTIPSGQTATVEGTLDVPGTLDVTGSATVPNATESSNPVALGQLSSEIAAQFTSSLTTDGYIKMPGGFIIQWGQASTVSGSAASITFPMAFPTACFCWVATPIVGSSDNGFVQCGSFNSTGVSGIYAYNGASNYSENYSWIAIGH